MDVTTPLCGTHTLKQFSIILLPPVTRLTPSLKNSLEMVIASKKPHGFISIHWGLVCMISAVATMIREGSNQVCSMTVKIWKMFMVSQSH